jgi:hypothetical protein
MRVAEGRELDLVKWFSKPARPSPDGNRKELLMLPSPNHVLTHPTTVKASDISTKPSEAVEAALLAVAIYHNKLSAAQCCKLAKASLAYFARVNSLNDREREQLSAGEIALPGLNGRHANGHANGRNRHSNESLVEHLRRSSADELAAAGNAYGVAKIFDAMIVPSIDDAGEITTVEATK